MTYQELLSENRKELEKYPEALRVTGLPITGFKTENGWVSSNDNVRPDDKTQKEINVLLDKVYEEYPERVIVGFAKQYSTLAYKMKKIRTSLGNVDAQTFFEAYGFYYDLGQIAGVLSNKMSSVNNTSSAMNVNTFDTTSNVFSVSGVWKSLSGKTYSEDVQKKIDYVMDKLLEFYPNKVVIGLNKDHAKFSEVTVVKTKRLAGFPDGKEGTKAFFADYGFTTELKLQSVYDETKKRREKEEKTKRYKLGMTEERKLHEEIRDVVKFYKKNPLPEIKVSSAEKKK